MKEDIYETIFFDYFDKDNEEESNFEIMSALKSIFSKYLHIIWDF
uniref:Uncharacterized protein n=1 Tax=viral metagenome TaxID=1070528 RepID=A0A6C0ACX5_9ZZZZ